MIRDTKILITGANGFIGKNLILKLKEMKFNNLFLFSKNCPKESLIKQINNSDFIVHLAGINRDNDLEKFHKVNVNLTSTICDEIIKIMTKTGKKIPIIFTSTTQVKESTLYGETKLKAENIIKDKLKKYPHYILRLPGVFGKWCKPNYNSVVATFCHNICRGKDIIIKDPEKELSLVHIDDVIRKIIYLIENCPEITQVEVSPVNKITVKDLSKTLIDFKVNRKNFITPEAEEGFNRALYSTFISYLPKEEFSYKANIKKDPRGKFCELLKSNANGQISFLTINPGFKRGGHYHNTKTEKFVVLKGKVKFSFLSLLEKDSLEIYSNSENTEIIDSIPGWIHELENIGKEEAIVLVWVNEKYDRKNEDTHYLENN